MRKIKNDSGITLIVLVITVIVILILSGVALSGGSKEMNKMKVENCLTNMITLRAKAKVLAEEINSEVWDSDDKTDARNNLFNQKYKMDKNDSYNYLLEEQTNVYNDGNCEGYEITKETLSLIGLGELVKETENGDYIVIYNADDYSKLEVVYPNGVPYDGEKYYTLSSLQEKMEE